MSVPSTRLDPYGAHLHLACKKRDWTRLQRRFGDALGTQVPDSIGEARLVLHTENPGAHLVVWIDLATAPLALDGMRTAVHEGVHVGAMLLDHIGQEYDGQSEALAYLVDHVVSWLWEQIAPHYEGKP